ncbi:MAG: hypothetical protein ACJA0P_001945 [Planctomycetota bacterium]|jgi:hypothetical protein
MSRSTRNLYQWKTETEEGEKRHVEAQLFGKNWTWRSRLKGEEEWTDHSKPLLEDLEELEHMIFNKYQRKHVSYDQLVGVRKLITDFRPGAR